MLHCIFADATRLRPILDTAQHAHRWGIKAAQAALPETSNPYRTPQTRAAWLAGYRLAIDPVPAVRRN
jgi:ribosome modulation factor